MTSIQELHPIENGVSLVFNVISLYYFLRAMQGRMNATKIIKTKGTEQ